MDISPCGRYLLHGVLMMPSTIVTLVIDLKDNHVCMKTEKEREDKVNFGSWMPLSSGHTMDICMGTSSGKLFLYKIKK